jgi:bifunctional DNase/RNase
VLHSVLITGVKENTYYAELHITRDHHVLQIDARPSDSIAVALRMQAPIFANTELLDLTPVDAVEGTQESGPLDSESLKTYLQNLDPEDFGKFTP